MLVNNVLSEDELKEHTPSFCLGWLVLSIEFASLKHQASSIPPPRGHESGSFAGSRRRKFYASATLVLDLSPYSVLR